MLAWIRRSLIRKGAFLVALGVFVIAVFAATGVSLFGVPTFIALATTIAGATCAALLFAAFFLRRSVTRRLNLLRGFLDEQSHQSDFLKRVPYLGRDEIGQTADATNRVLVSLTSLQVSLIDQERELRRTQDQLRLQEALAAKTAELEQRLTERRLLFEVLRTSAASTELDEVMKGLAQRVGQDMRFREFAILLRASAKGPFTVRVVHGFARPEAILGRALGEGDGLAGEVARAGEPILVADVSRESEYLAFWDQAAREGAFAAFPIYSNRELIGILAATRPADDPFTESEIRLVSAIADQTALVIRHAQLVEELREMSTHDDLTGLANRRLLYARLGREIERSKRFGHTLSALAIDIDHFKKLNDRCGHAAGDDALRAAAQLFEASVRKVDTVARVGGEEFVILLPQTDAEEAAQVAEKLRSAVERLSLPFFAEQPTGHLTVSIGIAQYRAGESPIQLVSRADDAMYVSKQQGRNRVAIHDDATGAAKVISLINALN